MEKEYVKRFRMILKRVKLEENSEKYTAICTGTCSEDEEKIWKLFQKFWVPDYSRRESSIDEYPVNDSLDSYSANRYIDEIIALLDKLGWAK